MRSKRFSPTPIVLAALVAAAFPVPSAAAGPVPAVQAQAAVKASGVQEIKLSTGLKDGKMVFLDEKGQPNPNLKATVGDMVEITISSGEGAQHDIVIPALNVASAKFDKSTGATKVSFKVTRAGSFEYYCTIAGHRQIGMEGVFEVSGAASAAAAASPQPAAKSPATILVAAQAAAVEAARPGAASVAMDPRAV